MNYRDDPEWQAAHDRALNPDAATPTERMLQRFAAINDMHAIETRLEGSP